MLAFRLRHFPLWLAIAAASIVCCCWQAVETAETDQHRSHKHRGDHHLHKSDLKRNKVLKKAIGKLLRSGVHYYSPNQLRDFKYFLSSISIPRSVNSKGHRHVRKFIKTTIGSLSPNWHVEEDSFATEAAGGLGGGGKVRFRNIVATYIPSSYLCSGILGANETDHQQPQQQQQQQRIVLSCHYDSLHPSLVHGGSGGGGGDYSRNGRGSFSKSRGGRQFVGATDAAVSCSILLSLAQYITPYLALVTKHKPKHNHKPPPIVQLIFFDGEEALLDENHGKNFHRARSLRSSVSSNSRNALYGSRHLAREWELEAANVQNSTTANSTQSSKKRKKKRSRQFSAETSSIFKSAAKLAATADQLCKLSSAINSRPRDNYRSRRSTENDADDEDESAPSLSAEANEVVPRGEHEDAAAAATVGGDDDEVIDSVVSSSARRHRLVVTDLDSSNDVEGDHRSVQGAGISQLALIEGASRLLAGNYHSLANIRLLLLLDLIGGPQAPRFFNTNPLTSRYFRQLAEIEKHLLASTSSKSKLDFDEVDDPRSRKKKTFAKPFFQTNPPFVLSLVRDDHLPFVVRNVPVVHLIPSPFPRNWHTAEDNLRSLNYDAIGRITRTLQIFLLHSLKV